jgi:hypothetical protein
VQDPALEAEAERMGLRAASAALPIQAKPAGVGSIMAPLGRKATVLMPGAASSEIVPARSRHGASLQRKPATRSSGSGQRPPIAREERASTHHLSVIQCCCYCGDPQCNGRPCVHGRGHFILRNPEGLSLKEEGDPTHVYSDDPITKRRLALEALHARGINTARRSLIPASVISSSFAEPGNGHDALTAYLLSEQGSEWWRQKYEKMKACFDWIEWEVRRSLEQERLNEAAEKKSRKKQKTEQQRAEISERLSERRKMHATRIRNYLHMTLKNLLPSLELHGESEQLVRNYLTVLLQIDDDEAINYFTFYSEIVEFYSEIEIVEFLGRGDLEEIERIKNLPFKITNPALSKDVPKWKSSKGRLYPRCMARDISLMKNPVVITVPKEAVDDLFDEFNAQTKHMYTKAATAAEGRGEEKVIDKNKKEYLIDHDNFINIQRIWFVKEPHIVVCVSGHVDTKREGKANLGKLIRYINLLSISDTVDIVYCDNEPNELVWFIVTG